MGVPNNDPPHTRSSALLHDIGKMGIPNNTILKPFKLTSEEWKIMRHHMVFTYEMLQPIKHLRLALDIPRYHHEKRDRTGYPEKLKGNNIPISVHIFAIMDVWDAITNNHPYRNAGQAAELWSIPNLNPAKLCSRSSGEVPRFDIRRIKTNGLND